MAAIQENHHLTEKCRNAIEKVLHPRSDSDDLENISPSTFDITANVSQPSRETNTHHPVPCHGCGIPDRDKACVPCYEYMRVSYLK